MFLPLGDEPNPPKPQWITRILLAANIAIHLFVAAPLSGKPVTARDLNDPEIRETLEEMVAAVGERQVSLENLTHYDLVVFKYGYKPGKPNLLALLACMFLHAGWLHLLGNMLYLWIFGDNVEYRLGPVLYPIAYLVTGVVATASFGLLNPDSMIPLVGASGAISGVLGFYLVWFPRNRVRVLFWFFIITFIYVPASVVLVIYVLIDNLLPFLAQAGRGGGGVAHAAHLGGFLAGVVAAFLLKKKGAGRPLRPPRPEAQVPVGIRRKPRDAGLAFSESMQAGRMEDAAHAFAQLSREGGTPPQEAEVFTLANWLYENDFVNDAAAVFRYYLRHFPRGDDVDRVNLGMGILLARRLGKPVSARQYLLTALELAEPGSPIAERAKEELDAL